MAHELNFNEKANEYAFFSRKEIPWHGLGQIVENALTSEEAIRTAHLDYEVAKFPIFSKPAEGVESVNTDYFMTVRTDTNQSLGIVGSRYHIVQNLDAFGFIDEIIGSKCAVFETAGALGKGERIFITAKMPTNIRIQGSDDVIDQYILFTNSHDGSAVIQAGFTPIRVVCNNTLTAALNSGLKNRMVIRHTSSAHNKLGEGLKLLHLQRLYSAEFSDMVNMLAKKQVTDANVKELIDDLLLTPEERLELIAGAGRKDLLSTRKINIIDKMNDYIEMGVGQDLHRGSAFWLWNGVTSYLGNGKNYDNDTNRFLNLTEGNSAKMSQKALDLVLSF